MVGVSVLGGRKSLSLYFFGELGGYVCGGCGWCFCNRKFVIFGYSWVCGEGFVCGRVERRAFSGF